MDTIKAFFGIFIIVAMIYLGIEIVPPYFENYQFQDFVKNEALTSTYTTKTEDDIRAGVLKKAQEFDIPLTKDQIKVVRTGAMGSGSVSIATAYTVHINLPGYPFDMHFSASSDNKSVM
jgi:hypothetical protein